MSFRSESSSIRISPLIELFPCRGKENSVEVDELIGISRLSSVCFLPLIQRETLSFLMGFDCERLIVFTLTLITGLLLKNSCCTSVLSTAALLIPRCILEKSTILNVYGVVSFMGGNSFLSQPFLSRSVRIYISLFFCGISSRSNNDFFIAAPMSVVREEG